jgi:repressor LexA
MTKHDAERKLKIIDYIAATLRTRGVPPSVREIALAVNLASTSAVHHHLQILEREGYLERGAGQARSRPISAPTRRWPCRRCSPRAATPTSCGSAVTR